MHRYLLEVCYKGTFYSGFQIQENAPTIQSTIQKVLLRFFKQEILLTGSSRTDSGVHAHQNFFHFDYPQAINAGCIYNLNAMLPNDIAIKSIQKVDEGFHCRFSATSRVYHYHIYRFKNPFLKDTAYYYPYKLNIEALNQAAKILFKHNNFKTFSKRNTQVKTYNCNLIMCEWKEVGEELILEIESNRFLRGMVRGLVATMLKVGRGNMTLEEFDEIIKLQDCTNADFSAPACGLFLVSVKF